MEWDNENLPFEKKKIKCLLWCSRHCCLGDEPCGINIEIHHIDGNNENNLFDNLIPLCFNCHSAIQHYNKDHPRGTKYKEEEIKARRNQIYEKYTSDLVPVVIFGFDQTNRELPNVGTYLKHCSERNDVGVLIKLQIEFGESNISEKLEDPSGYYTGKRVWNLNPGYKISGNLNLPQEVKDSNKDIRIIPTIILIDKFDYQHKLRPNGHVYNRRGKYWYLEP